MIHLLIDSHGNSNLPQANASPSGSSTNIFDLAIGHFVLNRGELFYNDKRMPITADIHDLNARAAYQDLKNSYDATLSYRNGQVLYGSFAPFTHDLELALTAGTSGIVLKSLVIRSGESSLQAQGTLTNYPAPSFEGAYQASLSTQDLLKNRRKAPPNPPGKPSYGLIDTNGTLTYRNSAGPAAIDNLSVTGTFRSPTRAIRIGRFSRLRRKSGGRLRVEEWCSRMPQNRRRHDGRPCHGSPRDFSTGGSSRSPAQRHMCKTLPCRRCERRCARMNFPGFAWMARFKEMCRPNGTAAS